MRALLAAVLLVLVLGTGTASADTFVVVPDAPPTPFLLPSAETPNEAGTLLFLPGVFDAPFLPVVDLPYAELHALWLRAGGAYGIPWQVLAAINKIESNFGRNMGPSSAGAVGWMQFMPETWLRWGMDASGDGIADPWNPEDAVHSAARYLAAAGGRTDVARSIFAYNHAQWYVDDVLELAALFSAGLNGDIVFTLDRMALELEDAQVRVAELGEALGKAEEHELRLATLADRQWIRAQDAELLSDELLAQKDLFQADGKRADAAAEAERLRTELHAAETALDLAQSGALSASFLPAAAALLRMPSRADGYVFPVGGGPATVTVGHDHHDYPAADIAAPLGAPVYALTDAVVLSLVDGRPCGTGLTLGSLDGLEWVYCHLAYRDESLRAGAVVTAGQWVGLVGSTGRSTGPHLHLGLEPARYPQEMPWFQEFANVAFTWQDVPADRTAGNPIFAVVSPDEPSAEVFEFTLTRS